MNLLEFSTGQLIRFLDHCIHQAELEDSQSQILKELVNLKNLTLELTQEELFTTSRLIAYLSEHFYQTRFGKSRKELEEFIRKDLEQKLVVPLTEQQKNERVNLLTQFIVLFSNISEHFTKNQCPNPFLNPPVQSSAEFLPRLITQTWIPLQLLLKLQMILMGLRP
jgi:hypothetical protein